MPRGAAGEGDLAVRILPMVTGQLGIGGAVVYLPVGHGIGGIVQLELLGEEARHGVDEQRIAGGHHRLGAQEGLLLAVRMLRREGVVLPDDADGGIDAVTSLNDLIGQLGAVAVADHVRTPFFRQFKGQLFIPCLARQGKATLMIFLIHGFIPPMRDFLGDQGGMVLCHMGSRLSHWMRMTDG